ncbi:MAG TPA: hypothetical protein VEG65_05815 [Candidatus Bathyarchaeia archaeon]|nr:hypothetical protein [Candidatus Bathyarchaeia archaeon]
MKKLFFAIIVAALLTVTVCAAGCTSNTSSPSPSTVPSAIRNPAFVPKNVSGYLNYNNQSAGIAIQYPPSWQLSQGAANATASFNVSGAGVSFTVAAPESLPGQTLDQFSQGLILGLQQNGNLVNVTLLNSSNTALAGYPAQKDVFTYVGPDGTSMQGMAELTLVNGTGYALTYVAPQDVYSTYVGAAQNMMQSFNITK